MKTSCVNEEVYSGMFWFVPSIIGLTGLSCVLSVYILLCIVHRIMLLSIECYVLRDIKRC